MPGWCRSELKQVAQVGQRCLDSYEFWSPSPSAESRTHPVQHLSCLKASRFTRSVKGESPVSVECRMYLRLKLTKIHPSARPIGRTSIRLQQAQTIAPVVEYGSLSTTKQLIKQGGFSFLVWPTEPNNSIVRIRVRLPCQGSIPRCSTLMH